MSAKKAVLKVHTLGHKTTNMQLTDFHIPAGQNTTAVFLFGDCMMFHSKLSLAISLLKLSSSLAMLKVTVFAACIMSWHVQVCMSCSSLLHVTHLLILLPPLHTHLHLSYFSFARNSMTTLANKYHWQPHYLQHTAETLIRGTCTKPALITKSNYLIAHITGHVHLCMALMCVTELWLWLCMTFISTWTLLLFSIYIYIYIYIYIHTHTQTDGWNGRPEQW